MIWMTIMVWLNQYCSVLEKWLEEVEH